MTRRVIHQELSPDGKTRLIFFQRNDEAIAFIVEKFWIDDLPEDNYYNEYWAASGDSTSIFDSLDTAIREARVHYPWLGEKRTGTIGVQLLAPIVEAIEACSEREEIDLRFALNELAKCYPDLIALSDAAIQNRSMSEVERVFSIVKKRFDTIGDQSTVAFEIPYLHHIRINCATGRLHIGHGSRSALVFP